MKSFMRDDRALGPVGAVVLTAAILLLGLAAVGVIQMPQYQAQAPAAGAAGGGFVPPPPPPPVGMASLSRDQMDAANKGLTQAAQWTLTLVDPWAGATVTDNGVGIYEPKVKPDDANAPVYDTGTPGTQNTNNRLLAGGYYTVVYRHSANTYYPVSLCDPEGTKFVTPCKVPVAPNPNIQRPGWDFSWNVRRVGTISDPVEENAATDSRNVNWANGQSNITLPAGGDQNSARCLTVSTTDGRGGVTNGAAGSDFTPSDGDAIWFNDTACSGSFYFETMFECSTTANRWCHQPVVHPKFNTNNQSGNEFSGVTLTDVQGGPFTPSVSQVSTHFNSQLPIKFYTDASPWKQSAAKSFHRWTFSYTAANVADGECWDMRFDDNGEYLGWLVNQTTTGSASQNMLFCQYSA